MLTDARGAGVGRWIVGGDVVLFGAWPAETVARLRELADAAWLRGNTDRWLIDGSDRPETAGAAAEDCVAALDEQTVAELAGLPFDVREGSTLYVHASAASDMRSFLPEFKPPTFRSDREAPAPEALDKLRGLGYVGVE